MFTIQSYYTDGVLELFGRPHRNIAIFNKMCIFALEYKTLTMLQSTTISPAQYEILNMLSCITREEDVVALKSVIVQFLNSRLQNELDRLWENGDITEEKITEWGHEHMRTPYRPQP